MSRDGRTMTLISNGISSDGKPFKNIQVFDKQ